MTEQAENGEDGEQRRYFFSWPNGDREKYDVIHAHPGKDILWLKQNKVNSSPMDIQTVMVGSRRCENSSGHHGDRL